MLKVGRKVRFALSNLFHGKHDPCTSVAVKFSLHATNDYLVSVHTVTFSLQIIIILTMYDVASPTHIILAMCIRIRTNCNHFSHPLANIRCVWYTPLA